MAKTPAKPKDDDKKPGATSEGETAAPAAPADPAASTAQAPAPAASADKPTLPAPPAPEAVKKPAAKASPELSQGAADVLAERARQVEAEGYSAENDDALTDYQLPRAAACYVLAASGVARHKATLFWPFAQPMKVAEQRRRNLIKAAALILAEIERLDRDAEQA